MKRFLLTLSLIAAAFAGNLNAGVVERDGYFISDLDAPKFTDSTGINPVPIVPTATPAAIAPIQVPSDPIKFALGMVELVLMYIALLLFLAICVSFYFLPTIIGCRKRKRNRGAICVLNLLTGWSFVGWVGALIWACTKDAEVLQLSA